MINQGDKVRFIDEAIEGTVTAIVGKDRAEVLTGDGFHMIAMFSQLVKVRSDIDKDSLQEKPVAVAKIETPAAPVRPKLQKAKIFSFTEDDLKEETIYAAFELLQPESPLSSAVQLHLINNTGFNIAFSLSRKFEMRDEGIAIDKMEPRSVKTFLTYMQDELNHFEAFRLQAIIHPTGKTAFRAPMQKQFRFNPYDVLESPEFNVGNTNCLFIPLIDLKQAPEIDITPLVSKFTELKKEDTTSTTTKSKSSKSKTTSRNIIHAQEKIVDLHIEELVKDYTNLSNSQMISLQLKHFQYEMDKALINHLHKITFIHGVGEGVLRSAIREELKKYEHIEINDAPAEKFGYGATEVVFK